MSGEFSQIGLRFGALFATAALGFAALGAWQLQRREWKRELMARVQARVQAPPVATPERADWPHVTPTTHEYLRVIVHGHFDHGRETLVRAATALGAGYWVLTPLVAVDGRAILVNRGFVPPEWGDGTKRAAADLDGDVVVRGLLRISEPGVAFLRSNDAATDRWHSRDVAAITSARGLFDVAPYFVDAEVTQAPSRRCRSAG